MFFRIQDPGFLGSKFFWDQAFQGPGFPGSRFFWVQVSQGPGFSGSGSRVHIQGPGRGFRSSLNKTLGFYNNPYLHIYSICLKTRCVFINRNSVLAD